MVTATVGSMDEGGRGVAKVGGKVTFIDGALTGETVIISKRKSKPTFDLAVTDSVLRSSVFRSKPKCISYDMCGGCCMQHAELSFQVANKQRVMEEQFRRIGEVFPEVIFTPIQGEQWSYRNRARLSARYVKKKGTALVGFRERKSSFVTDMRSCDVLSKRLSRLIGPLADLISGLSIRDKVPQIEMAEGENGVSLILRNMAELSQPDKSELTDFGDSHNVQIFLQPKGVDSVFKFYPDISDDEMYYNLPDFGLKMIFKPTQFTQVNFAVNRVLVRRAVSLLEPEPGDYIGDFFCGIGNFSLAIARRGGFVHGFEGEASLTKRAIANANLNNLDKRAIFDQINLFKNAQSIANGLKKFNKILIDPPRDGASTLVSAIADGGNPKRIVYVSCNSATLARDAGVLVHEKGYKFYGAGLVNMFPNTSHAEAIAWFERTH